MQEQEAIKEARAQLKLVKLVERDIWDGDHKLEDLL